MRAGSIRNNGPLPCADRSPSCCSPPSLLCPPATAACRERASADRTSTIVERDYRFFPQRVSVPDGLITFRVRNDSHQPHNFQLAAAGRKHRAHRNAAAGRVRQLTVRLKARELHDVLRHRHHEQLGEYGRSSAGEVRRPQQFRQGHRGASRPASRSSSRHGTRGSGGDDRQRRHLALARAAAAARLLRQTPHARSHSCGSPSASASTSSRSARRRLAPALRRQAPGSENFQGVPHALDDE